MSHDDPEEMIDLLEAESDLVVRCATLAPLGSVLTALFYPIQRNLA